MRSLFFLPLVLLLLCNIISSCSSSKSKGEAENDSIAIAKLDSLRQDSIRRRDFLTPDLAFHNLHGDVKRCIQSISYQYANDDLVYNNYNDTLIYDEKGNWTNEPTWSNWVKKNYPEIAKKNRVVRNPDGQITRIYCEPEWDDEYESFEWDGEKLAKKGCKYNDYGLVTYAEREGSDDKDPSAQWLFYDYVIDDMGNWIERKYFIKTFNPHYPNNISMSKGIDTREIEYYNSNGSKTISLPNNDLQKQALTEYREYERKMASKNEGYYERQATSEEYRDEEERTANAQKKLRELQILSQIEELGEQARRAFPEIEALYNRLQRAQAYGPSYFVEARQNLSNKLDEVIELKNKQIRLAKQLDDNTQLVKELEEQKSKVRRSADMMLYGTSW
ncbi:MAG: hypothetical protein HDS89_06540 [Bacteroidales bacterium]|nr:hypothetical protein [Bacteroidales bacterium]